MLEMLMSISLVSNNNILSSNKEKEINKNALVI